MPDYIDGMLGAFLVDPPRIWAGGPTSGRFGGVAGFAPSTGWPRSTSWPGGRGSRDRCGIPEREFNGPVVGLQERYRAGLADLGPILRPRAEDRTQRLRADARSPRSLYEHCCEGMYGAPEYGGNRDTVGWQAIDFPGDVQPRGYTDAEVWPRARDRRRHHRGSGPGGSTAADVLTRAGWTVIIIEKGRNHLIDPDDLSRPAAGLLQRRDQVPLPAFPRARPADRAADVPDAVRRTATDLTWVRSTPSRPPWRRGDPRRRQGAALSSRGLPPAQRLRPIDGSRPWPTGRSTTTSSSRTTPRSSARSGWRAKRGPTRSPPGARGPTHAVGGAHVRRRAVGGGGRAPGLASLSGSHGGQLVPYDGRPACNNCGFCAYFGCPIHAKGDPVAMLQHALATGRAELLAETFVSRVRTDGRRATGVDVIGPDGVDPHIDARHVVVAGGAIETPRLLLLSGIEHPLIGRNLMMHFQTMYVGIMPERSTPTRVGR